MSIQEALYAQLQAALWECCPAHLARLFSASTCLEAIITDLADDAQAFAQKDPATHGDPIKVVNTYTSYRAVLHYRLAHSLELDFPQYHHHEDQIPLYASLISSRGKLLSGAELHHKSAIGKRFILDHGVGTVIGETSQIGDDCYILGAVTLGASGISNNPRGKRHPSIGHRVQIGAFTRIFGPVEIGNDVFIGPGCTIIENISDGSRVTLQSSIQITRQDKALKPLV